RSRDHHRRAAAADARDVPLHHGVHGGTGGGDDRDPLTDRNAGRRARAGLRAGEGSGRAGTGTGSLIYLILASAFGVSALGVYIFWSLRRLRELERIQGGRS